jgi:hypothetical protein
MLMFMTSRLTRSIRLTAPLLFALAVVAGGAHAGNVSKCIDAAGHPTFTDVNGRGCTVLIFDSTIPAPPQHRSAAPLRSAAAPASAPADFPKVNTSQQRARDDDRREILNDELRSEEKKLGDLRRDFNNGEPERQGGEKNYAKYQERVAQMRDDIGRAEKNVDALKREIANIR